MRQKLGFRQLRADAAASEQIFKIAQLVIDVLVAERLFRRHIGQLAEDHFIRIPERIDAHALFFAGRSRAADAEIRVDEKQRLDGQVFKFQVPRGVVGGDIADLLHVMAAEPLPGVIIVQIGNAAQILAPAAEFSDVMPQRRRADQRQVDRESGLFRENGRVQSDIVDADGMRCGVEGRRFHAEAHDGHKMAFPHGLLKACILRLHAGCREWHPPAGAAGRDKGQRRPVCLPAPLPARTGTPSRPPSVREPPQAVREHLRAELLIERG